jgi:hypothetical protein
MCGNGGPFGQELTIENSFRAAFPPFVHADTLRNPHEPTCEISPLKTVNLLVCANEGFLRRVLRGRAISKKPPARHVYPSPMPREEFRKAVTASRFLKAAHEFFIRNYGRHLCATSHNV